MSKFDEATKTALYTTDVATSQNSASVMKINPSIETSESIDKTIFGLDSNLNQTIIRSKNERVHQSFVIKANFQLLLQVVEGAVIANYSPINNQAINELIASKLIPKTRLYLSQGEVNILIEPHSLIQVFECGF